MIGFGKDLNKCSWKGGCKQGQIFEMSQDFKLHCNNLTLPLHLPKTGYKFAYLNEFSSFFERGTDFEEKKNSAYLMSWN